MNPKVTVCMCTRNRAKIMLHSIKCILDQTYKDFELLIINDASEDNTEEILKQVEEYDNRVRHITLKEHNFILARNTAFKEALGEYICIMDSDDLCSPNRLEEQVKFLEMNTDIDIVSCKMQFGKKSSMYSIPKQLQAWNNDFFSNQIESAENISMLLQFATIMIRKSILERIFPNGIYFYEEGINGGEDTIFLYTLYFYGAKFSHIITAIYLYNYLEYSDSISGNEGKHYNQENFIFKYIHDKPYKEKKDVILKLYNKYNNG